MGIFFSLKRIALFLILVLFSLSSVHSQCPGPAPCAPGAFTNTFEQIDPSSIVDAVFCSGQTRTFTISVGPGTTTEAATGDIEYVTLFLILIVMVFLNIV